MEERKRDGEFCEMGMKFHTFGWKRINWFRWVCLCCGRKKDEENEGFRRLYVILGCFGNKLPSALKSIEVTI